MKRLDLLYILDNIADVGNPKLKKVFNFQPIENYQEDKQNQLLNSIIIKRVSNIPF
jgi:hypothetical protein